MRSRAHPGRQQTLSRIPAKEHIKTLSHNGAQKYFQDLKKELQKKFTRSSAMKSLSKSAAGGPSEKYAEPTAGDGAKRELGTLAPVPHANFCSACGTRGKRSRQRLGLMDGAAGLALASRQRGTTLVPIASIA